MAQVVCTDSELEPRIWRRRFYLLNTRCSLIGHSLPRLFCFHWTQNALSVFKTTLGWGQGYLPSFLLSEESGAQTYILNNLGTLHHSFLNSLCLIDTQAPAQNPVDHPIESAVLLFHVLTLKMYILSLACLT